jgi:hypothetical protein
MINFNLGMNDNNQNEHNEILINFNHSPEIELSDIVHFEVSRERAIQIEVPDLEINDENNNGGNQDLIQNNNDPTLILNQNNYIIDSFINSRDSTQRTSGFVSYTFSENIYEFFISNYSIKIERENNIIFISNKNNSHLVCIHMDYIRFDYSDNEFKILWNHFKKIKILSNVSVRVEFNYFEFLNFLNSEYAIDYIIEKRSSQNYIRDYWNENKPVIKLLVLMIIIVSITLKIASQII